MYPQFFSSFYDPFCFPFSVIPPPKDATHLFLIYIRGGDWRYIPNMYWRTRTAVKVLNWMRFDDEMLMEIWPANGVNTTGCE